MTGGNRSSAARLVPRDSREDAPARPVLRLVPRLNRPDVLRAPRRPGEALGVALVLVGVALLAGALVALVLGEPGLALALALGGVVLQALGILGGVLGARRQLRRADPGP